MGRPPGRPPLNPKSDRDEKISTLAVDREIASQVREMGKDAGVSTLEMANQLLAFAMNQNDMKLEVKTIVFHPKAALLRLKK